MKTQFVTAIYSNLHGTIFGGRPSRYWHYRYSLLSLLKMISADFICYTAEEEIDDLKDFFYEKNLISQDRLKFKIFNLQNSQFQNLIVKYKNEEEVKKSMRCCELQYLKFHWISNLNKNYTHTYWIDAGLSHCGLFPNKFLDKNLQDVTRSYYECSIFTETFLQKLNSFTKDKIFAIGRNNEQQFERFVPEKFFKNKYPKYHIIGGIFGGKIELISHLVNLFNEYCNEIIEDGNILYFEEQILTAVWANNQENFKLNSFDTWWHENSGINGITDDPIYFQKNKSFYKIFEELLN
jgi:hypothetical protein